MTEIWKVWNPDWINNSKLIIDTWRKPLKCNVRWILESYSISINEFPKNLKHNVCLVATSMWVSSMKKQSIQGYPCSGQFSNAPSNKTAIRHTWKVVEQNFLELYYS
jgi:hypothetical protein